MADATRTRSAAMQGMAGAAHSLMGGPDRLPPLPPALWSEAQREAVREVVQGPRGALIAPFVPLMRSPELMTHAQRMGAYLRYRSRLGLRLSEFAILLVARQWSQPVEWAIHAPIALREGVAADTVAAIAAGQRPASMPADEAAVYDFCQELESQRTVSDAQWQAVAQLAGGDGVVDLLGLVGYYTMLAMVMNASRTPAPAGPALPPAERRPRERRRSERRPSERRPSER